MAKSGGIIVPIISSLDGKGFRDAETAMSKLGRVANVALAAVAAGIGKATQDAANYAETVNKSQVIFGQASAKVEKFAESAAKIGLSKQAALDAASTFAVFGKSAGLANGELANFSTDLTSLAADLASFNNTTPEEAITAIGAALRGESEPIRRFGVLLDDATLRAEALSLGLIKTTKQALTPQQKVLAAQSAILKQTADAQGDFSRTSDSAANSQRILLAEFQNLSIQVGNAFLPILNDLLPVLKNMATFVSENTTAVTVFLVAVGSLAAIIKTAQAVMAAYAVVQALIAANAARAAAGQLALNAAMLMNPIGIIIALVAAFVAAIIYLWNTNEGFRDAVIKVWEAIKKVFSTVWEAIKTGLTTAWENIRIFFNDIPGGIAKIFLAAANIFKNIGKAIVDGIWNGIKAGWDWLVGKVKELAGNLADAAKSALGIKSPSRVFMEIGRNVSEGMAIGIDSASAKVTNATEALVRTPNTTAATQAQSPIQITVNGALDPESVARQINNILKSSAARTGNYTGLGVAPYSLAGI